MNCLFSNARPWLALAVVSVSLVARAQTITDAVNPSGYGWFGYTNEQITLSGTGFLGVTNVSFNGVKASHTVNGESQIFTWVPTNATSGLISVTKVGNTVFSPKSFQVVPRCPYVTSFNPSSGTSNTTVFIQGLRFAAVTGTNDVWFNGVKASYVFVSSDILIHAKPPAHVTTGPITVRVTTGVTAGTHITTTNFFGQPLITGFSPSVGRTGTNVVITGTNFTGATSLLFNGQPASFTVNNNNQITATVPANATTGPLTLTTPSFGFPTSSNFVVRPTVTGTSPNFGPVGTSVTVNGANLNVGTPVVRFGSITAAAPTGVTFGQLTAVVPNGATTGFISVSNVDGIGTSPGLFYLPPRITSFSPTNSPPGSTVTILGTNFTDASAVNFNGTPAAFTVTNNNTIGAIVPNGFTTGPISITTPAGTTNTSKLASTNFFAAPIITGFAPTHGLPGTNVALLGTNFLGTLSVTFNGVPGTGLVVSNNNSARITVPASATTGPIALTAPAGTATTTSSFFLDYPPALNISTSTPPLLLLSWPITFFTYTLQTNANLAASSGWTNVLTAPTVSGGSNFVTQTNLGATMFYRLKR